MSWLWGTLENWEHFPIAANLFFYEFAVFLLFLFFAKKGSNIVPDPEQIK